MDTVRLRLRVFLIMLFFIIVLGTIGFIYIEGLSLADALYFCIVTIATVGYGDIHPVSQAGKIVAILLIICGVGTFLGVIANATEMFMNRREKQIRTQKLHIVIGLFFSEVGTKLLAYFSSLDPQLDNIRKDLVVTNEWSEDEFSRVNKQLRKYHYKVEIEEGTLEDIRSFLEGKSNFLLRLFENPVLLEQESFTGLLGAVFHVREELLNRRDLGHLPDTDISHLAIDIKRAYVLLVHQWLDYMRYLKGNYPYLFSLAMRTNPFDREASPVVR
jgi:voltage-gated potassium channel